MDMRITRGTTPTFNFILPFSSEMDNIILTFTQNGEKIRQYEKSEMTITPILTETENSDITDENSGDEFISNNIDVEYPDPEEDENEVYCNCSIMMSQEDTLSFIFYPAAEKNIAVSQFKILVNNEVFVSDPVNFRIMGDLDGNIIGPSGQEEQDGQ